LSDDQAPSSRYRLPSLSDRGAIIRLLGIGAALGATLVSFAYVGGWLSPHRLTAARLIDGFEQVNGVHAGFRRNHAKGVCISGYFDSNGRGAGLSRAVVFKSGRTPVIGRFAFAGGQPFLPDGPKAVRSLALSFRPAQGQEWRTGMIDIPVFAVSTPQAFYEQLLAAKPDPATGKPDPAVMKAFLAHNPDSARAVKQISAHPRSSGFDNSTFNGLDAFLFVNAAGASTPVRWSMQSIQPFAPLAVDNPGNGKAAAAGDDDYLFDALIAQVRRSPLRWRLVVTIGRPGDPTSNATLAWPLDRAQLDVGTLTIDQIAGEAQGNCRDINFDPLVLPAGIAASDDPLLSTRSAAYAQSFRRRAGEAKRPSAVQIAGQKGP
jgi:catalase